MTAEKGASLGLLLCGYQTPVEGRGLEWEMLKRLLIGEVSYKSEFAEHQFAVSVSCEGSDFSHCGKDTGLHATFTRGHSSSTGSDSQGWYRVREKKKLR